MTSIGFTPSGPPETVLAPEPGDLDARLAAARSLPGDEQRTAISALVADNPTFLAGWAAIGDLGRDPIERYAAYRVGYHRGLDRLRQSGWRGSGYVRWQHETNRGFLSALAGLAEIAGEIGDVIAIGRVVRIVVETERFLDRLTL